MKTLNFCKVEGEKIHRCYLSFLVVTTVALIFGVKSCIALENGATAEGGSSSQRRPTTSFMEQNTKYDHRQQNEISTEGSESRTEQRAYHYYYKSDDSDHTDHHDTETIENKITVNSNKHSITYDPYVTLHQHHSSTKNKLSPPRIGQEKKEEEDYSTKKGRQSAFTLGTFADSNNNDNNIQNLQGNSSTCLSHQSCQECYDSSSTCHWCSDGTCHAKGSVYGCMRGITCPSSPDDPTPTPPAPAPKPTPTPPTPDNKKKKQNCSDHATCSECALSSMFCHWCGYDNQCHAIGSLHGCTTGVNCYANQRCHRSKPEPLDDPFWISLSPMLIIYCIVSSCIMMCCYTCCFCGMKATKGAYDDMVLNTAAATADVVMEQQSIVMSRAGMSIGGPPLSRIGSTIRTPSAPSAVNKLQSIEEMDDMSDGIHNDAKNHVDNDEERNNNPTRPPASAPGVNEGQQRSGSVTQEHCNNIQSIEQWENLEDQYPTTALMTTTTDIDETSELSQTLLPKSSAYYYNNRRYLGGDGAATRAETILSRKSYRDSLKSRNTQCLFGCCSLLFVLMILITIGLSVITLLYFPRMPKYNVCNNEFDWKSIVEGMASAKLEAEFELLLSIQNPNRFDVELVMGSGTFTHDGTYVGRFDIPPHTLIGKQSISDVLVTITLKPDKWEALALTTEYYRGTLVFNVNTAITITAPALMGYTYGAKFGNVMIHITDDQTDDRSLCACPQWKDEKKKKPNTTIIATDVNNWDHSMKDFEQTLLLQS